MRTAHFLSPHTQAGQFQRVPDGSTLLHAWQHRIPWSQSVCVLFAVAACGTLCTNSQWDCGHIQPATYYLSDTCCILQVEGTGSSWESKSLEVGTSLTSIHLTCNLMTLRDLAPMTFRFYPVCSYNPHCELWLQLLTLKLNCSIV